VSRPRQLWGATSCLHAFLVLVVCITFQSFNRPITSTVPAVDNTVAGFHSHPEDYSCRCDMLETQSWPLCSKRRLLDGDHVFLRFPGLRTYESLNNNKDIAVSSSHSLSLYSGQRIGPGTFTLSFKTIVNGLYRMHKRNPEP
jgi:hypothetical protein